MAHDKEAMTLRLKIWRQRNVNDTGELVDYTLDDVSPDQSFLEMIDVLNRHGAKRLVVQRMQRFHSSL